MSQPVSLKNLFINGSFGSVVLGMNPEKVRLLLGIATAEYQYNLSNPDELMWVYGNIAFFFKNQVLAEIGWQTHIYTYEPCLPDAGLIPLDPWIIWNGLTVVEAERELRRNSINFRKVTIPKGLTFEGDSVVELITSCNTRLIFRSYLNWQLEGFNLSKRFQIDTPLETFLEFYTY
ncbi:hypothetical protein CEN41_02835 [Fischerella thermalis CCMEE 5330]|uniref:Uncharacterized protein n=1 Tax=Fischerella thermalis CCMEE 5330 TaxID=2019670 RepID=A0A2N6MM00_9CYAN|nr:MULTISPECIES: hypothetical protein [Fischerella]PMB47785.1 hypothetical protein CEN41_02835 [Fischerella thermalis CCMEE 5330]BAU08252.1 hypothetical protein FIS3754_41940 [Fischerella sp. NIES-3754]BCX10614.1 MAG: hypothetical protein KatS3mg066_4473 [Fischerella sp.]